MKNCKILETLVSSFTVETLKNIGKVLLDMAYKNILPSPTEGNTINEHFCTGDLSAKLQELSAELEDIKMRRMAQETDISLMEDPASKVKYNALQGGLIFAS